MSSKRAQLLFAKAAWQKVLSTCVKPQWAVMQKHKTN